MTCRFADGREIAVHELSMAEHLRAATRAHAEEIELSVPDGPGVKALLKAAPIHSEVG